MASDNLVDDHRCIAGWRDALDAAARVVEAMSPSYLQEQAMQLETLNTLASLIAGSTLRKLGLFETLDAAQTLDEVVIRGAIVDQQRRAFCRLIAITVDMGLLVRRSDGRYQRRREWLDEPSVSNLTNMRDSFAENVGLIELVLGFGRALPDILTGRLHAAEMLFRDGLMDVATRLYSEAAPFRYCNTVAVAAVNAFTPAAPNGRGLHIVEIGAGTGATAKALVRGVSTGIDNYLFTDVSKFFLSNAKEVFVDHPFMNYEVLDIEAPIKDNLQKCFDIAIAAHVLHATSRVDDTLIHVRSLLKTGGILILLEETSMQPFFSVTMGTQTGFDRFQDMPVRTDHPLLEFEQWKTHALRAGFRDLVPFPEIMGIRPMLVQT